MKITMSIYDLISWIITIISVMLFIFERRKNSLLPYYMAVQGILRACKTKAGFYGGRATNLKIRKDAKDSPFSEEEYILFAETVYSDFASLMDHIMGSLKAIEPNKDMPFDVMDFTKNRSSDKMEEIKK